MRGLRPALATLALTLVAAAGLVATPGAYADPSAPAAPSLPQTAVEVLKNAVEPTLALTRLYAADHDEVLARPDGSGPLFGGEPRYPPPGAVLCGAHICVHYATTKALLGPDHRPPAADANTNSVPDWVEKTSAVMENVWNREIGQLGYRTPQPDGTRGGDAKLDVYLADIGKQGFYGYAQPEEDKDGNPSTATAHMVLDNDFKEFEADPLVSLRATAAHEFFHVVQFGYDVDEQSWLLETTATWMEEQVYDSVNDNRNYLDSSSLRHPEVSLDSPAVWYGNWVFFQFVSERLGRGPIQEIWERASKPGVQSRLAILRTLAAHGTSLRSMFSRFGASSNVPASAWTEGRHFPQAAVTKSWTLSRTSRSTGPQSVTLAHLASRDFVFVPGASLTGTWRLRVRVEGPSTGTTAYAIVRFRNGSLGRYPISLNRYGNGSASLRFSQGAVSKVYLNLGNAYSANGRRTDFIATATS